MIIGIAKSKNGVNIRLTEERWKHITTAHPEIELSNAKLVLQSIKSPEIVFKGDGGELLAVRKKNGNKIWLVVAYREVDEADGFILTAYITTNERWLFKREVIWNKKL